MKKSLRISLISLSILGLGVVATQINFDEKSAQYQPRNVEAQTSQEGLAYMNSIRANQITGQVDPADVVAAQNYASQNTQKNSALGLNWTSKGPDNMGGRSRGFLIDKDNSNVMYLGSVTGGIFKSTTGGSSWTSIDDFSKNLGVMCIAEGADGTLYYGTGEGLYSGVTGTPNYSISFVGGGMFKSTDDGATWNLIPSTEPTAISSGASWSSIGNIITHKTNKDILWAGTNKGLQRSTDGGTTWANPITIPGNAQGITDMNMDANGGLWVSLGGRVMYSSDGTPGSFTEISKTGAGPGDLPRSVGRVRVESAPSDANYVYACLIAGSGSLNKIYKSTDKGATWSVIGQKTSTWDPFEAFNSVGLSGNGQGGYDLAMRVDPNDKNRLILGGIDLFEYTNISGWKHLTQWFAGPPTPWAVHGDQHNVFFHPTQNNVFFVVNDGGLFKTSDNGFSYVSLVKEFNTVQYYGIAVGEDRTLMGGAQDNGSTLNDGSGNTSKSVMEILGGDGGQCALSWLDGEVYFGFVNGSLPRTENGAESWDGNWFDSRMGAGAWNGPFALYENESDLNSADSVIFVAIPSAKSLGFGSGQVDSFYNVLGRPQESADFVTNSFRIFAGGDTIVSDSQGNLSGAGHGFFNDVTGEFSVVFDKNPVAEIIVVCLVNYSAGSKLVLNSKINELPFMHTVSTPIGALDSVKIQDPVQATYVVGLIGGVWMTRQPLDFSSPPEWWKIANLPNQRPSSIDISDDGDVVYVGTSFGRVYTISNLNNARDIQSADVELGTPVTIINSKTIANGRFITSVAADPNDPNKVVATAGNYGNQTYVYYSTNALSATPSYLGKQGLGLPKAPVYASVIDKGDGKKVILGTEFGIYATDNITTGNVNWTAENTGFANAPVLDLIQYRTHKSSDNTTTVKEGDIYLGSYARGFYVSTDLVSNRPISVSEETIAKNETKDFLFIYPNPAKDYTKVKIELLGKSDIKANVIDLNGRVVKTTVLKDMSKGEYNVRINLADVANGTYVMSIEANGTIQNSTFIVNK